MIETNFQSIKWLCFLITRKLVWTPLLCTQWKDYTFPFQTSYFITYCKLSTQLKCFCMWLKNYFYSLLPQILQTVESHLDRHLLNNVVISLLFLLAYYHHWSISRTLTLQGKSQISFNTPSNTHSEHVLAHIQELQHQICEPTNYCV